VQSAGYWSSSNFVDGPGYAWYVLLYGGFANFGGKTSSHYVWPVRGGQ